MRESLEQICKRFNTDKLQSSGYAENYEFFFGKKRDEKITILELGVNHGGSLLLWQDYFTNSLVLGVDIKPNPLPQEYARIRFYQGSQADADLLNKITSESAPDGYDIIIDDAAHIGELSLRSFEILFDKLKPGGVYVLEDWGTGYWGNWPDGRFFQETGGTETSSKQSSNFFAKLVRRFASGAGKSARIDIHSHNAGMVGLLKKIVDEVGWADITHPQHGNSALKARPPKIRSISIFHGQAFILKN